MHKSARFPRIRRRLTDIIVLVRIYRRDVRIRATNGKKNAKICSTGQPGWSCSTVGCLDGHRTPGLLAKAITLMPMMIMRACATIVGPRILIRSFKTPAMNIHYSS